MGAFILVYTNVSEPEDMQISGTNFAFCVFVYCYALYKTCYRHSLELLTLSIEASRKKVIGQTAFEKKSKSRLKSKTRLFVSNEIQVPDLLDVSMPLADTVLQSK